MMKQETQQKLLGLECYVQGINATPAFIRAADVTGILNMQRRHGFGYHSFIYVFRNDYAYIRYSIADLNRLAAIVIPRCLKDRTYSDRLLAMTREEEAPLYAFIDNNLRSDPGRLEHLSDTVLIAEYRELADIFYSAFTTSHIIESIALTTDTSLRDQIRTETTDSVSENAFPKLFADLMQPVDGSYLGEYTQDLYAIHSLIARRPACLRLLRNSRFVDLNRAIRNDPMLADRFQKHLSRYFWIESNWRGASTYTAVKALRRIKDVLRTDVERSRPAYFVAVKKKKKQLLRRYPLSRYSRQMIRLTETVTKWQDDRKRAIVHGVWAMDRYLALLARRFGLKQRELRYLLPHETTRERLASSSLGAELHTRRKLCVLLAHKKEFVILTGSAAERAAGILSVKEHRVFDEIDGITASLGSAIGKVRLCLRLSDIKKIQPGEILVTMMTRPEFVPAMKKAAAVVTDEGGLTSHAAIVSRELKKPCVIGTKIATTVFKDGDIIEVNANHGWIRRI